jgi:hypothetical protein
MQVMPFCVKSIGTREHNLFHLASTCATVAPSCHYVDMEKGNLYRSGRYNGSPGGPNIPIWSNRMAQTLDSAGSHHQR